MTKISIIVPVYNVEKYLDRCLSSLVNQTAKDFEVIIVNDGSLDNSQTIIDKYVKDNNNFKSYIKKNGGLGYARNYGIDKANGEYLMFVDSDDYVEPNLVNECLSRLEHYDLLIFEYNQINEKNKISEVIKSNFKENKIYQLNHDRELLNNIDNCAWNKCYKRELFIDVKYPDGWYEDLGATYIILDKAKKVGFINKPLINYISSREDSISNSISTKIFDIFEMNRINLEYYKSVNRFNKYKDELQLLTWTNIVSIMRKLPENTNEEIAYAFVDSAFDFMKYNFGNRRIRLEADLMSNVYENRFVAKLYMKYRGFKDE